MGLKFLSIGVDGPSFGRTAEPIGTSLVNPCFSSDPKGLRGRGHGCIAEEESCWLPGPKLSRIQGSFQRMNLDLCEEVANLLMRDVSGMV